MSSYPKASIPQPGRSLQQAASTLALPIHEAIRCLNTSDSTAHQAQWSLALLKTHWSFHASDEITEFSRFRATWQIVCIWILANHCRKPGEYLTLNESEQWFRGSKGDTLGSYFFNHDSQVDTLACNALSQIRFTADFMELLPYILEPLLYTESSSHGLSQRQNASTAHKRASGVFYTPSDVAMHICNSSLGCLSKPISQLRSLDPAVGTGVFLLALSDLYLSSRSRSQDNLFHFISNNLFGIDVCPLTCDIAAFCLLLKALAHSDLNSLDPIVAWHLLRTNIITADSISLIQNHNSIADHFIPYKEYENIRSRYMRNELHQGLCSTAQVSHANSRASSLCECANGLQIGQLFPSNSEGFDLLVGNPPYSKLPATSNSSTPSISRRDIHYRNYNNSYFFFIEMMSAFTKTSASAAGLVVPMSIAFAQSKGAISARKNIERDQKQWKFEHYDREPHSLFGESVKTRNTILLRSCDSKFVSRHSSLLLSSSAKRWSSKSRSELFKNTKYADVSAIGITSLIPKVSSLSEVEAYRIIDSYPPLSSFPSVTISSVLPSEAYSTVSDLCTFVGCTAYNYLNVFIPQELSIPSRSKLSSNRLVRLTTASETANFALYAFLSSHLVYWLWVAKSDGFHVPRWFIRALPSILSILQAAEIQELSNMGSSLWHTVREDRLTSINKGKLTIRYSPLTHTEELFRIDELLSMKLSLPVEFLPELHSFTSQYNTSNDQYIMRNRSGIVQKDL